MPIVKAEFYNRAKRLVHGEFRAEDIDKLFLYLRTRSKGRQAIAEIGDFVAHREEREKSLITKHAKDWFIATRFTFRALGQPYAIDDLPMNFGDVFNAVFGQLSEQEIRKHTGLKRRDVKKLLPRIVKLLEPNGSGGLTAAKIADPKEWSIIVCLTRYFKGIGSTFSEDQIFNGFRDALIDEGLLEKEEAKCLSRVRKAICLNAVTVMHLTEIDLGDGTKAKLSAIADCGGGTIGVMASAPVFSPRK